MDAERRLLSFYYLFGDTVTIKRSILSSITKLYDPLEWAAPIAITAKLLLQELWLLKGDWDDSLPPELNRHWSDYHSDLKQVKFKYLDGLDTLPICDRTLQCTID